jgi:outer membrane protein
VLGGCSGAFLELDPDRGAPASASSTWSPPAGSSDEFGRPPGISDVVTPEITREVETAQTPYRLTTLVDVALRNSPLTRNTWEEARAAAAAAGVARGSYYPQISIGGGVDFNRGVGASGTQAYEEETYGPSANLSWLLFDFGGREATIDAAVQTLIASNFEHNQEILDLVLGVSQAYYQLVGAQGLVTSGELSVDDAAASVRAARARMEAQIATAYDALQAEATLAQTRLNLDLFRGQLESARGLLSATLGLPANVRIDVAPMTGEPPVERASASVDALIEEARRRRPDLGAAWATLRAQEAKLREAEAARWPQIQATGSVQKIWGTTGVGTGNDGSENVSLGGVPYDTSVAFSVPIFEGFTLLNQEREARAEVAAALAEAQAQDQQAIAEVWNSYANLVTAGRALSDTREFLEASRKAYEAARVSYANGLGSILELLQAQIALAQARQQQMQTVTSWYVSLAQLAHDAGILTEDPTPDDVVDALRTGIP